MLKNTNIYISTGGFSKEYTSEVIKNFIDVGIFNIELSGGLHDPNIYEKLFSYSKQSNVSLIPHNYFPAPSQSFVINLASSDYYIYESSINLAKQAIKLAALLGAQFYSVHAGFLIDPLPKTLGGKLQYQKPANYSDAKEIFINALTDLSEFAAPYNIRVLVENNVLTQSTYETFGMNPLLLTEPQASLDLLGALPPNSGMLLDVGHLNVTSKTLDFDKISYIESVAQYCNAAHISSNSGFEDENLPVFYDEWFWGCLPSDLGYYSLEVYNSSPTQLKHQLSLVSSIIYP